MTSEKPENPKRRTSSKANPKKKLLARMKARSETVSLRQIMDATGMKYPTADRWAKKNLVPSLNRSKDELGETAVIKYAHSKTVKANADTLGIAKLGPGHFHINTDPKKALRYIIREKDDGLTAVEAKRLLHHDLFRHLQELENVKGYELVEVEGDRVWIYTLHRQRQINRRRTNKFYSRKKELAETNEDHEPITVAVDEVIEAIDRLHKNHHDCPLPLIARMGLLKHFRSWSDRQTSRELRHATRRDRTAQTIPTYAHSTISRKFREVDEEEQIGLEQWLIAELIRRKIITNKTLAIDSTHIEAYCSDAKISKGGIEGAAWGVHQGYFYGYKLSPLVDSDSELPVEWTLTSGAPHDVTQMGPLVDAYKANYPDASNDMFLGDGGYDSHYHKLRVEKKLNCAVITAKNPRRNKLYQWAKKAVSKMWKLWGGKLATVSAYLKRLPQKLLTADREAEQRSILAELIRNLMFMARRVAVERFFSRLRAFTMADKLVHQTFSEIRKFIRWAIIAMLAFSLAMVEMGIPKNKLRYGHLV